jgi:hypothetical protein
MLAQESEEEQLKPPCIDLSDYKLKIDHFDQMHVLTDENRLEGSDNFRQVKSNVILSSGFIILPKSLGQQGSSLVIFM